MDGDIIFGARPVLEAIDSGKTINRLYIRKGAETPVVMQIVEQATANGIAVQYVPVEKLNRLTRNNHQGVVAEMSPVEYYELDEIVEKLKENPERMPLIVLMDSITDVRNFGAIARSAECAGADAIVMPKKNSAPVNGEAIKSSAGALNIIPVCRVGSVRNTIKQLAMEGYAVVAATEKAPESVYDADVNRPLVLVMGSEDKGISREVLKMCDTQVSIPMRGKTESLNVSAAAAVILFEILRQRR